MPSQASTLTAWQPVSRMSIYGVRLHYSTTTGAPSLRIQPVPRFTDPVQIQLPYLEILLAGIDHRAFHVQLLGETLDRPPPPPRTLAACLPPPFEQSHPAL